LNPSSPIRSIVILPLENLSGDAKQDYLADGITEELTADISKLDSLRVISRTSAMQYRHNAKGIPAIAKELDVDAVVEGSIVRSGDEIKVTAQLIRTADDKHVWADTYQRPFTELLSVEAEIANEIARRVQLRVGDDQVTRLARKNVSPQAYDLFLQARYAIQGPPTPGVDDALPLLQKTIDLQPDFAPAYVGLSQYYGSITYQSGVEDPVVIEKEHQALLKALELDPGLAEAHAALGHFKMRHQWDWKGAEVELKQAIALDPNSSIAHRFYS